MCGFAGEFLYHHAGRADLRVAVAMADRLRHRGPDEDGHYLSPDGRCAMAFRRLSVIDPADSHQPMTGDDGRYTVAFNGEIYNFQNIRNDLIKEGVTFKTRGDTEVLLHLYARYGPAMLEHLDGMFALVVYDATAGTLFLARDRLGQKPLWLAARPDRLIFASEATALPLHPAVTRQMDNESLVLYTSMGYIPAPRSLYADLQKLPPAHHALVRDATFVPQRYWSPEAHAVADTSAQRGEQLRELVMQAVASHRVSDVPLGALLSGGVDSAVITTVLAKLAGKAGGVRTFTAGFEDADFDERAAARAVAEHCRTEHTELLIRPQPAEMLDKLVAMYGEPFADSSALPTYLICRAARQHVTVALAGDGGDEVFAGYDRYRAMHLAQRMGWATYLAVRLTAAIVKNFTPQDERRKSYRFVRFAQGLSYPPSIQYFTYCRLFGPDDLNHLFTQDFLAEIDVDAAAQWFCDLYEQGDDLPDEVVRAQRHDMLAYLPGDLLVKTDIASMASSLELRAPMLDHRLVNFGLSLPTADKIAHGRGKALLRRTFADMLPPGHFDRPKRGFAVPLGRWLREDLLETLRETLLDRSFTDRGIFRPTALAGLINDHAAGRGDHRHRLWALLVFARWLALQK